MKKAIITLNLPDYELIDKPMQYETQVGILLDEREIANMESFFHVLKLCPFLDVLINSKEHYRKWYIKGMLKDYFDFGDREHHIIQGISNILQQHNKYTGLNFNDFEFKATPTHTGKVIKSGNYEYKTELDLIRVLLHNQKWEYTIKGE